MHYCPVSRVSRETGRGEETNVMNEVPIWIMIPFGTFFSGSGISSATWLWQSGVPTANAALIRPSMKQSPSLFQPVRSLYSVHTNPSLA